MAPFTETSSPAARRPRPGVRAELDVLREAKRRGAVVLAGEVSLPARALHFASRPVVVGSVVLALALAGLVVAVASGAFEPGPGPQRLVTVTDDEGNTVTEQVADAGVFINEDGGEVEVLASEPLPEDVALEVAAAADAVTVEDVASGAIAATLGEKMATTGKPYIAITPQRLSCDGDEYFDGYQVIGDFDQSSLDADVDACEMQRTLAGARDLAQMYASADGVNAGTFEMFEVALEAADEIYAAQGGTPESSGTLEEAPAVVLTNDQLQTHGGDA